MAKQADPTTDYAAKVVAGKITAGPHVRASCARHLRDLDEGSARGLIFDRKAAARALGFFPDVLRLSGGMKFDGQPFKLHASQQFKIGSIFGWKKANGFRRFRRVYCEEGKGNGKALALDTVIPTPTGWSTMGALSAGDMVIGADGKPCRVLQAHPVSVDRECFEVEFDDGEVIVASAEHLWLTEHRRPKPGSVSVKTTADIARTLRNDNGKYQSANHSVSLCGSLDLPEQELLVAPYVLGAWLGDGDSDAARLTCAFAGIQVVEEIASEGQPVRQQVRHSDTTGRFSLSSGRGQRGDTLKERLRRLGVLRNKHVPPVYLRASDAQRLALLQGLMDTDGSIATSGQCEFTATSRALAEGVLELALSLGLKATLREGSATLNGVRISAKYRVGFFAPWDRPVFRLKRKADRQAATHSRRSLSADRRIVSCRPVQPVPVRCITVDSPDSMFLCGRGMVPTHNSPLAAGIGLYGLVADNEPGAEIYAAAAKQEQAMIMFRDAVSMVRQSPMLEDALTPSGVNPVHNLAYMKRGSFFRPLGRDTGKTGSGLRPHFVLIDELHEHPNGDTVDTLERGFKWRDQPLLFMITNSGSDRNSVCWREREWAVKVAHGEATPDEGADETFSFICALDEGDDPLEDPKCWEKANPLIDVLIGREEMAKNAAQAKAIPGKANGIRRLHFCQWTGSESAWIARETWEDCEDPDMTLGDFAGQECWIGLDLGATKDMTARAMVFRDGVTDSGDQKYALFAHGYSPAETLRERMKQDRAPYDVWQEQGFLTATPGKVVRFDQVAHDLVEFAAEFEIAAVAYDRWLIRQFEVTLDEMGVTLPLVEHPQGTNRRKDSPLWMPDSINGFEDLILERRLRIAVNPALRSAVASSTFWQSPAGLRRFEKQRATARIDLAVAAAMAVGAAMTNEETDAPSIYETRGVLVF